MAVSFNLAWAVLNRSHHAFEFDAAPKVTHGGADSVSFRNVWAEESHYVPFVDVAGVAGNNGPQKVDDAIGSTRAAEGRVFFLGLLDLAKPTWDVFLGARCGVPYERFDRYRSAAHLKAQFRGRTGTVSLGELQFPSKPGD